MTCDHALLVSRGVGAPNGRGPRFLEPAEPAIAIPLDVGLLYGQPYHGRIYE